MSKEIAAFAMRFCEQMDCNDGESALLILWPI